MKQVNADTEMLLSTFLINSSPRYRHSNYTTTELTPITSCYNWTERYTGHLVLFSHINLFTPFGTVSKDSALRFVRHYLLSSKVYPPVGGRFGYVLKLKHCFLYALLTGGAEDPGKVRNLWKGSKSFSQHWTVLHKLKLKHHKKVNEITMLIWVCLKPLGVLLMITPSHKATRSWHCFKILETRN